MQRLYDKTLPQDKLITHDFARLLIELAKSANRQVGVLVDRKGTVQYVVLGNNQTIFLPEIGRARAGKGRFRGLRFIHAHLHSEGISRDDLTDLCLLALDCVVVVNTPKKDNQINMEFAHLLPDNPNAKKWEIVGPIPVSKLDLNFKTFIEELEGEFKKTRQQLIASGQGKERAVLVYLDTGSNKHPQWEVQELIELAQSAGLEIAEVEVQTRRVDPKYFIGKGKLFDVVVKAMQREADLLVFCPDLTPAQVKAISDFSKFKVIDRSQLILDIFAQRAHSAAGKLQVELAQLEYLLPRLVGAGKAMSRLIGGIGLRGPGETKLEIDRRRVKKRITTLQNKLQLLEKRRNQQRKMRLRRNIPIAAIVGYTNAGKSTLLNAITHANARVENKLFATLDPYSKRLRFPEDKEVIFIDTVGFIRALPPSLQAAFKATLEELADAWIFLHVVDLTSPYIDEQMESVQRILDQMNLGHVPRLLLFNKCDLVEDLSAAHNLAARYDGHVISALDRKTLVPVIERIQQLLQSVQSENRSIQSKNYNMEFAR